MRTKGSRLDTYLSVRPVFKYIKRVHVEEKRAGIGSTTTTTTTEAGWPWLCRLSRQLSVYFESCVTQFQCTRRKRSNRRRRGKLCTNLPHRIFASTMHRQQAVRTKIAITRGRGKKDRYLFSSAKNDDSLRRKSEGLAAIFRRWLHRAKFISSPYVTIHKNKRKILDPTCLALSRNSNPRISSTWRFFTRHGDLFIEDDPLLYREYRYPLVHRNVSHVFEDRRKKAGAIVGW